MGDSISHTQGIGGQRQTRLWPENEFKVRSGSFRLMIHFHVMVICPEKSKTKTSLHFSYGQAVFMSIMIYRRNKNSFKKSNNLVTICRIFMHFALVISVFFHSTLACFACHGHTNCYNEISRGILNNNKIRSDNLRYKPKISS